jgi:Xaa-Pro aminopeptidase
MSTDPRTIPETGAPFGRDEYARRWLAVLDRLPDAGLDAIAVTANSHQEYLGGYDGNGDYFGPFPLILSPGREPAYVVRRYDADAVRAASVIDDIVPYTHVGDFPATLAATLRRLGLDKARLGLELDAWCLAPADVARLQAELPELEIVDAGRLVPKVAAVKSAAELEVMRRAAALADAAVEAFDAGIADGARERDVARAVVDAIEDGGGSALVSALLFGQRTALPHGQPGGHRLERNQPAFIEIGAEVGGYVAGLCRSAVLGSHAGAEALYEVAEEAVEAGMAAARPGATAGDLDAAVRGVVERHGRSAAFRHRAGYQIGLMWNDRGNVSLEPDSPDVLVPDMTFHLPVILFEQGEFGVGASETILVTETGAERLATRPRRLHRVP